MQVIAGKFRGRKLAAPEGKETRPTTGRMRERIFSMLQHHRFPPLAGAKVADLFAGTGALGIEALSRGASHATFVEKSSSSLIALKKNISDFGLAAQTAILKIRATEIPVAKEPFSHIFMDPPYGRDLAVPTLEALLERGWVGLETVIICELQKKDPLDLPEGLEIIDERSQGIQRVVFLQRN